MCCVGRNVLLLQAQQHHTVQRVKTCLNLVLLLVGTTVAQLYDKGQHFVVSRVVKGEFAALQQLLVQLNQHLHGNLVNLQVSLLAASLLIHHAYQVAKPVGLFLLLFVVVIKALNILALDALQRAVECSHRVFHLPHIQQILGNVGFSKFVCYKHILC